MSDGHLDKDEAFKRMLERASGKPERDKERARRAVPPDPRLAASWEPAPPPHEGPPEVKEFIPQPIFLFGGRERGLRKEHGKNTDGRIKRLAMRITKLFQSTPDRERHMSDNKTNRPSDKREASPVQPEPPAPTEDPSKIGKEASVAGLQVSTLDHDPVTEVVLPGPATEPELEHTPQTLAESAAGPIPDPAATEATVFPEVVADPSTAYVPTSLPDKGEEAEARAREIIARAQNEAARLHQGSETHVREVQAMIERERAAAQASADSIRVAAEAEANRLTAQAIAKAREDTKNLLARARQEADQTIRDAGTSADAHKRKVAQDAENLLKEAEDEAGKVINQADESAQRILQAAEQKAQELVAQAPARGGSRHSLPPPPADPAAPGGAPVSPALPIIHNVVNVPNKPWGWITIGGMTWSIVMAVLALGFFAYLASQGFSYMFRDQDIIHRTSHAAEAQADAEKAILSAHQAEAEAKIRVIEATVATEKALQQRIVPQPIGVLVSRTEVNLSTPAPAPTAPATPSASPAPTSPTPSTTPPSPPNTDQPRSSTGNQNTSGCRHRTHDHCACAWMNVQQLPPRITVFPGNIHWSSGPLMGNTYFKVEGVEGWWTNE